MNWRIFLALAMLILSAGLIAQNELHPNGQSKTVSLVATAYRPDGSVNHVSHIRETIREDGSWARDTVVVETATGKRTHGGQIRDFSTGRSTTIYYDLGVKTVAELDPNQVHAYHTAVADCLQRVQDVGPQVGDDPMTRKRVDGAKEVEVTFDRDLGCNMTETEHTQDGRLVSERRIVSSSASVDDQLLHPDLSDFRAVTRLELLETYESVHGRPMLEGSAEVFERIAELDQKAPFILNE